MRATFGASDKPQLSDLPEADRSHNGLFRELQENYIYKESLSLSLYTFIILLDVS